jgi:hypothetical protein
MRKDASRDFKQGVWDYDRWINMLRSKMRPSDNRRGLGSDDLTDWITTFEGDLAAGEAHAIEKWQRPSAMVGCGAGQCGASSRC